MNRKLGPFLLVAPGLAFWLAFLIIPCGLVLAYTFMERGTYGGVIPNLNFDNLARAFDGLYLEIFVRSARIALEAAIVALVIGYPAALAISKVSLRWQMPLLLIVILPFWSNYLIRTYAWIVMLNRAGIVNQALLSTGLISQPLNLLYTEASVVIGLVYSYLPFVILTIYASIQRLNPELTEASEDLGATPWKTLTRITLPLTMPGIAAGGVFVFVLSIGNFVTPQLLGGGRMKMVGNLIQDQFTAARDWPFGSALALVLITIMLALLTLQGRIQQRIRKIEKEEEVA
ncbi:ABC transporter permease [Sinorhizobium mexicanum]|uniref:ABC transporter permease n=1 Tax=Sinorhizobium mexicanum TaxID=375549 RepID=A0A859QC60_9HYPH|nr:ABC transporter permease [Sinorhizobium mexicanum]MBP1881745.1 spermidine/putrescine transport system permease protein [Sinorhizobium mexicanum]QLL61503.1 ABC transporter permease [Sinorhizobium mexicanum]